MTGKLSVIGIGPGDPELLTLKAVRIIRESDVLCVPKGREEGSSLALSIVGKAVELDGKEIIEAYFPMRKTRDVSTEERKSGRAEGVQASGLSEELDAKWNQTVKAIHEKLTQGIDVAFLTLGDPTVYSTFFYLYDKLLDLYPDMDIEIIPGVSSINAAASRAGIYLGLGNDKIAVLPANYMDNLESTLEFYDTVILMKVNKVFDGILNLLAEMDLVENAVCVSRAGLEDEKVYKDIREVRQEELNYFSMVIVRR